MKKDSQIQAKYTNPSAPCPWICKDHHSLHEGMLYQVEDIWHLGYIQLVKINGKYYNQAAFELKTA